MITRYIVSLSLFSLLFVSRVTAQPIPNPSFEEWSNGLPVGWFGLNLPTAETITQTSDAHSGSSAVLAQTKQAFGVPEPFPASIVTASGSIQSGVIEGFPLAGRPDFLTGWYKFTSAGGDVLAVIVTLQRKGQIIGGDTLLITSPTETYTKFNANIEYNSNEVPDTAIITVAAGNLQTESGSVGTSFQLDDVEFMTFGYVSQQHQISTRLSPNPANEVAHLSFSLDEPSTISLEIFNVLGERVYRETYESFATGPGELVIDTHTLPIGAYRYRLSAGGARSTGLLQVSR